MLSALRLARAAASLATAAASTSGRSIGLLASPATCRAAAAGAPGPSRSFAVGGLRWASTSASEPASTSAGEGGPRADGGRPPIGAAAAGPGVARPSTSSSSSSSSRPRRRPAAAGGPPPPPWAPTADLAKRKFLPRRMAHLMQVLEAERAAASEAARPLPDFRPGDALEVRLAVAENRGRPATLRGVCIARRAAGWRSSLTLLSHIPGGGVVTRAVPLHSPALQEVRVVERGRVRARRAKLYYLAKRNPKEWRV